MLNKRGNFAEKQDIFIDLPTIAREKEKRGLTGEKFGILTFVIKTNTTSKRKMVIRHLQMSYIVKVTLPMQQ